MSEQRLINAFMKLTAKVGAGNLVRSLVQQVDENGNPKVWTAAEIEHAVQFINNEVERFGKPDALEIIHTLMKKFDISPDALTTVEPIDHPGVKGLQ
jgi:hypothetical protein